MSRKSNTRSMDAIQFPRLLAEINAIDLTQQQVEQLCEAMDLEPHHLDEVFSRAEERWKAIKADAYNPLLSQAEPPAKHHRAGDKSPRNTPILLTRCTARR